MNELQKALKKLSFRKELYIKYKFNMWFKHDTPQVSEEEFLNKVKLKTMDTFVRWEKSSEFRHISSLILESRQANDLIEIYDKIKSKVAVKNPNNKDIEMLLKLMREINQHSKEARSYFNDKEEQKVEEDDLEL